MSRAHGAQNFIQLRCWEKWKHRRNWWFWEQKIQSLLFRNANWKFVRMTASSRVEKTNCAFSLLSSIDNFFKLPIILISWFENGLYFTFSKMNKKTLFAILLQCISNFQCLTLLFFCQMFRISCTFQIDFLLFIHSLHWCKFGLRTLALNGILVAFRVSLIPRHVRCWRSHCIAPTCPTGIVTLLSSCWIGNLPRSKLIWWLSRSFEFIDAIRPISLRSWTWRRRPRLPIICIHRRWSSSIIIGCIVTWMRRSVVVFPWWWIHFGFLSSYSSLIYLIFFDGFFRRICFFAAMKFCLNSENGLACLNDSI